MFGFSMEAPVKPLLSVSLILLGATAFAQRGQEPGQQSAPAGQQQGQRGGGGGLGLPGPFTPPAFESSPVFGKNWPACSIDHPMDAMSQRAFR